ncbi:MAG: hypothetical protein QM765_50245 [Myxococcales bacterium]
MSTAALSIHLAPIGSLAPAVLAPLARPLAGLFGCDVEISRPSLDPAFAFDASRRQFDASKLMLRLLALFPDPRHKVVGVLGEDLFAPCLTWVYGQGQVDGPAAVVSRHRLDEHFYGRPSSADAEQRRLLAEIGRQLGHTFGLLHCHDDSCAMRWSETVEEIEAKGAALCAACRQKVQRVQQLRTPITAPVGYAPSHA